LAGLRRALTVAFCAAMIVLLARQTAWIQDRNFFEVPNAFVNIQLQARAAGSPQMQILPLRLAGAKNPYGMYANVPFRTYSRRGVVSWVIGRNAYFNSLERHRNEERVFRAATGTPLWEPLMSDARRARAEDPWRYYFGIGAPDGVAGAWSLYYAYVARQSSAVSAMDLDRFKQFAREAGATHVLVCKDPTQANPPGTELSNPYFALVPVGS
jgi:hypothetical protein